MWWTGPAAADGTGMMAGNGAGTATVGGPTALCSGIFLKFDRRQMPRRTSREKKRSTPEDSGEGRSRGGRVPRVEPTGVIRPLPPHLATPTPQEPTSN